MALAHALLCGAHRYWGAILAAMHFPSRALPASPTAVDGLEVTPSLVRALETSDEEAHFSVTKKWMRTYQMPSWAWKFDVYF